MPPPTYHGSVANDQNKQLTNPPISPQKQRNIRTFNTPKSPAKISNSSPAGNPSFPDTNLVNKEANNLLRSEPSNASSSTSIKPSNDSQLPQKVKAPNTPTKKKQSTPKTPTKSFLNSTRRDRFASSEESSPLKRIREGKTSNYAADHEAEMERLGKRYKDHAPSCDCMNSSQQALVPDTGPYYVHLGHAKSIPDLRSLFEQRTGVTGDALRIEKIKYVPREGKTSQGCPVAKYIVRRRDEEEKYLVAAKHRLGHHCEYTWTVTLIIAWDGLNRKLADNAYDVFAHKLANYGLETRRQCDSNSDQSCACQGPDDKVAGASYTFGCSWSMYFNSCKFAKSMNTSVRKFRLDEEGEEEELEDQSHLLATAISPLFKRLAPQTFGNMTAYESLGSDCRIGLKRGRPFSGITTVADFCAHSHKDRNNMDGGATVIVTLTRPENRDNWRNPDDEQFHILPHYMPDKTDEKGSQEGQKKKVERGELNILDRFHRTIGKRKIRNLKCNKKKGQKQVWRSGPASGNPQGDRKRFLDQYARAQKMQKMSDSSSQDLSSSPLATPFPSESPKSSLPQLDGSFSPSYSSDGDPNDDYESEEEGQETIDQLDGVADYYSNQQQSSGLPPRQNQQLYGTGMPQQSQNPGMMGMNPYGGQPSNQHQQYNNQPAQYNAYGNPNMQPNSYNNSSSRPGMAPNSYPTPQMSINHQGSQNYQRSNAGMPMRPGMDQYQYMQTQQQSQMNGDIPYASRGPSMPSNQYSAQQQGYNGPSHQGQPMAAYHSGSTAMNGNPSMTSPRVPNVNSGPPTMSTSSSYGYRGEQYMPNSAQGYRSGAPSNANQHLQNNFQSLQNVSSPHSAPYGLNTPSNPLIPLESPTLPPPFGSVSDFKKQMISIRNEISDSDEDALAKASIKKTELVPQVSDSDASGSPFKTPARRPRTGSSTLKQTTKPSIDDKNSVKEEGQEVSTPDTPDIQYEEVDCKEVFGEQNRHIGGLAVSLPHGSLVIECAKAELHATTSLKRPNRYNPTRIGMVFYQHKTLNYPHHGQGVSVVNMRQKNERDYQAWKDGLFVPTQRKLQTMMEQGFKFPDHVATIDAGTKLKFEDIEKPDLSFLRPGDDGMPAPLELSFAEEHESQKQSLPSPPTPDSSQSSPGVAPGIPSPVCQQVPVDHVEEDIKPEIKEEDSKESVGVAVSNVKEESTLSLPSPTIPDTSQNSLEADIKSEDIKTEEIKVEETKKEEDSKPEVNDTLSTQ